MSLPWSPQQREWLQALGHPLMVLRAGPSPAADAAAQPASALPAREAAAASVTRPMPATHPDQALHRALLKATGLPAAEAERTLQTMAIDAAALRVDPAAKRLLWARLRRLRGGRTA